MRARPPSRTAAAALLLVVVEVLLMDFAIAFSPSFACPPPSPTSVFRPDRVQRQRRWQQRRRQRRRYLLLRSHPNNDQFEIAVTDDDRALLNETCRDALERLIKRRASARWDGDYALADEVRAEIDDFFSSAVATADSNTDEGFRLVLQDFPRAQGGGSTWHLVCRLLEPTSYDNSSKHLPGILNLAHSALGMAVHYSQQYRSTVPKAELESLEEDAKERLYRWSIVDEQVRRPIRATSQSVQQQQQQQLALPFSKLRSLLREGRNGEHSNLKHWVAIETDLQGRKAADAAFWFALAGSCDRELRRLLVRVCTKELQRFGSRPSCRTKDVVSIADRLAASGVRYHDNDTDSSALAEMIDSCMESKFTDSDNADAGPAGKAIRPFASALLDLHSDRCALMIWKFSARQRKQRNFLATATSHWSKQLSMNVINGDSGIISINRGASNSLPKETHWSGSFADPSRPLVVDVGCGMGISLLGLASLSVSEDEVDDYNYPWCNFVGVDLSALAIGYARSITKSWDLNERLAFVIDSAETLLEDLVRSYPGPVECILIQFPTPFRLTVSGADGDVVAGNSQLPASVNDGFMVTSTLLQSACRALRKSDNQGHLILQSNCEDIAVWMEKLASTEAGFETVNSRHPVQEASCDNEVSTQRTQNWIALGGERAKGVKWSAEPLLPRRGRTETEVACMLNGTPVHRCVLVPKISRY